MIYFKTMTKCVEKETMSRVIWVIILLISSCSDSTQNPPPPSKPVEPTPTPPSFRPGPDPLLSHAWHLNNTGQRAFGQNPGTIGVDARVIGANEKGYTGKGVRIAVSDTGVETSHEDLANNMLNGEHRNYDLKDPPYKGSNLIITGHGTWVAGVIGAVGNNSLGSRGVAHGAKLAGFTYLGVATSDAKRIDQANGNFDIFNYSYAWSTCAYRSPISSYIDQLKYGVTSLRGGKGSIYVKAAGNDWLTNLAKCDSSVDNNSKDTDDFYFGNATLFATHTWPYQIVVAGFNATGESAFHSVPGSTLWISSPAGYNGPQRPSILTTDLTGCNAGNADSVIGRNDFDKGPIKGSNGDGDLNPDCKYTSTFNGTSSAAPVVSGIVALMLEANPNLTWRDVKYILAKSADQVRATISDRNHYREDRRLENHIYLPAWVTNAADFNFHNYFGFGGVNAEAAVTMAKDYTSAFGTFTESDWTDSGTISTSNSIPDASATGLTNVLTVATNLTIEAVQIELSVTHTRISDVGVELYSPSSTKSVIIPINSNISGSNMNAWILGSNAFYGENSTGDWTLKLIDGRGEETGTLTQWKIKFFGH